MQRKTTKTYTTLQLNLFSETAKVLVEEKVFHPTEDQYKEARRIAERAIDWRNHRDIMGY